MLKWLLDKEDEIPDFPEPNLHCSQLEFVDVLVELLTESPVKFGTGVDPAHFVRRLERIVIGKWKRSAFPKDLTRVLVARLLAGIHGIGVSAFLPGQKAVAQDLWNLLAGSCYDETTDYLGEMAPVNPNLYREIDGRVNGRQRIFFPVIDPQKTGESRVVELIVSRLDDTPTERPLKIAPWCMYRPILGEDSWFNNYSNFLTGFSESNKPLWQEGTTLLLDFRMSERKEGFSFDGGSFGTALVLALFAIRERKGLAPIVATGQIECTSERLSAVSGVAHKEIARDAWDRHNRGKAARKSLYVIPAVQSQEDREQRIAPLPDDRWTLTIPVSESLTEQLERLDNDKRVFDAFADYREALNLTENAEHPVEVDGVILETLDFDDPSIISIEGGSKKYAIDDHFKNYASCYKSDGVTYSRVPLAMYLEGDFPKDDPYRTLATRIFQATQSVAPLKGSSPLPIDMETLEIYLRFYRDGLRLYSFTPPSCNAPLYEEQKKWLALLRGVRPVEEFRGLIRFVASDLMHAEFLREVCGEPLLYRWKPLEGAT